MSRDSLWLREGPMDCSLGDIDLNLLETGTLLNDESHREDHGCMENVRVPQEKDGPRIGISVEDSNVVQTNEGKDVPGSTVHEEPEEGEISDDNTVQETVGVDNCDKDPPAEVAESPACDPSPAASKVATSSYGSRWASQSNGDSRHGAWNLRSDTPAYSVQPDKFYQFAWAKGVQEGTNDFLGDSLQDERSLIGRKTGDGPLNRSGSADRKRWIVGDHGIEFVKCMRSEDGYFFLREGGDHSDQRRGEGWRDRGDRESSERGGKSSSDKSSRDHRNQSEERNFVYDRERRRSETRRYSRDVGKRDGRGEGHLEEGEIELRQAIMADKAARDRGIKDREKEVDRQGEKFNVETTGSGASIFLSEWQREKLFTDVTNNVRNVSVKDAQKSFMGVCRQLQRALRALRDLNNDLSQVQGTHIESQQRRVLGLTRDIFSGIRAAYAVRNTAVGKEQEQEQDSSAFPRLLELARSRCKSLFTSKQIQELESMMQAIGHGNRTDESHKLVRKAMSASDQTERGDEGDPRIAESSGNTSATTQLGSESTTENSANVRSLELGDEAEQPLNLTVDLNICEPFAEEQFRAVDTGSAGSAGFGDWFFHGTEQGHTQAHDNSKESESLPPRTVSIVVDLNEQEIPAKSSLEERTDFLGISKAKSAHGRNGWGFASHFDPIRALTYYHEKFAGKSQATQTRLPSPTPSDEGDTVRNITVDHRAGRSVSCGDETKSLGKGCQPEHSIQGSGFICFPSSSNAHQKPNFLLKENSNSATPPELILFPSAFITTVEDGSVELLQRKMVQLRGAKRSRDPRRRLDSRSIDLELSQLETSADEQMPWSQASSRVSAPPVDQLGSNQQVSQANHEANQETAPLRDELLSLLSLGTGGERPLEQTQTASITSDTGLQVSTVSDNSIENSSQKKRQIDFLIEGSTGTKRPRTALIRKDGDVVWTKAVNMASVDLGDNSKEKLSSETIPLQSGSLLKQGSPGAESGVDGLKQRMKPRDPRRALLGVSIQEGSSAWLAKGDSNLAVSGTDTTTESSKDAVVSISESVILQDPTDKPVWNDSIVKSESLPTEIATSPAKLQTLARTNSVPKSEAIPTAGAISPQTAASAGVLLDPDSSGNSGVPGDLFKTSRHATLETKMNVARPPVRFDLNVSVVKQRENVNHWDHLEPLLEGLDERQKQAVRQERARRIEEQSRMFVAKKLCLVLDLDHTLLNSAKFTETEEEWEVKLQANELTERNKFEKEGSSRRELYRFQHMGMWTKLRPGIWKFLARASHLYELHVYTMGNKAYATEMAKLLDPTGTLFAGRVISKGDDGDVVDGDERPPKSKDLDGVLGMESAVVIIDDSVRVWPHHRHNLIVVERYMYFPCSRKQFGLPGPSLLEVGHDEREQDGMLASALTVIEKIHYNFFSNPRLHEVDVRDILAKEQHRVLSGCKLVFSRVFPQGEIQPHLNPLWQLAEQFGAVCSMGLDDGVTHVVAISLGTEKVNWALSTGRYVVRPSWLEASAILYRRASERDFSVTP